MIPRLPHTMLMSCALLSLAACHPARQAPGMDVNDLSDGRGAHAGRFVSPANTSTDTNDTDTNDADANMTVESNP